jgi:hypothetical protein
MTGKLHKFDDNIACVRTTLSFRFSVIIQLLNLDTREGNDYTFFMNIYRIELQCFVFGNGNRLLSCCEKKSLVPNYLTSVPFKTSLLS